MAYAQLAGLPVTAGLYALLLPVLAYAFLGSGLRVMVGPEGAVALLVASALAPLAAAGSAEYTTLAAGLASCVGAVFLVARLLRLGWVADYFSQSVLVGYITACRRPDDPRPAGEADRFVQRVRATPFGPRSTRAAPRGCQRGDRRRGDHRVRRSRRHGRFLPRWPGALLVVVLGIVASWLVRPRGTWRRRSRVRSRQGSRRSPVRTSPALSCSRWSGPAVAIFLVSYLGRRS